MRKVGSQFFMTMSANYNFAINMVVKDSLSIDRKQDAKVVPI